MNTLRRALTVLILMCSILLVADISHSIECLNTTFISSVETGADQPSDLAVGPNGYVYLVDGVNNRIIVLDGSGATRLVFGTEGAGEGQFKYPLGIDVSKTGKVFVADSGNHRIQVFDLEGKYISMFAVAVAAGEKPADPVDVLASSLKGYIYVSDNDNHKIRVYDQAGRFQFAWGKFGEQPGEFRYPAMLAANEYNEIFVVDVLNTRIQKFDPFGKFITDIGSWGVLAGKLFRPKGVAVDKQNRVFVSDSYTGAIQAFTDLGRFLGVVCENNRLRRFLTPVGLFIDPVRQNLQVVEMKGNRISVLEMPH